jgi:hypothetical protein
MAKYYVNILYYASAPITVEANSREEAVAKAWEKNQACLCNHCSNHLELGDSYGELVCDEDGNEIEEQSHG